MHIDKIIDKINKSIFKDVHKKYVITGKVVKNIFLEKDRLIEYYESQLIIKKDVDKIINAHIKSLQKQIQELKKENKKLKEQNLAVSQERDEHGLKWFEERKKNTKLEERVKELERSNKQLDSALDLMIEQRDSK